MNRCVWVAIYAAAFGWCAALGSSVPLLFIGGPSLYDHAEHHVFPRIPYHALPQLQAALARDMPAPYPGTIAAYREILKWEGKLRWEDHEDGDAAVASNGVAGAARTPAHDPRTPGVEIGDGALVTGVGCGEGAECLPRAG